MMLRIACCLVVSLAAATSLPQTSAATELARVNLKRPGDLDLLLQGGFDLIKVYKSSPDLGELADPAADLLLKAADKERLIALGLEPRTLFADYEAHLAKQLANDSGPLPLLAGPPNFGAGAMGGYYTLAEMEALLDHYRTTYPSIVGQKQAIGTSHEGRTIWAIKISDNPDVSENEPRVMFDALHHSREPMSMHTAVWFLDHLVSQYGSDATITALVDQREVWFVLCVNPDGYVYNQQTNPSGGGLWRKNRRNNPGSCDGVDLNRNWGSFWGFDNSGSSGDTCSETYRGPSAFSEPETQALDAFMTGKNFKIAFSMHSFGEWMLEPWGYKSGNPPSSPAYPEYSADVVAFNHYTPGPAYDVLYPANGVSVDHYHAVHGALGFTPEIGPEFWPPISQAIPIAAENVEPCLLMVKYAGAWLASQGVSTSEVIGDGDGFAEPGETLDLSLLVRNKGQLATGSVALSLTSPSAQVVVIAGSASLPSLPSLTDASSAPGALRIQIAANATAGATVPLELSYAYAGLQHVEVLPISIGQPRVILRDNLESELGWIVGAPGDAASTGQWERVDPTQKTQDNAVIQPGDDATTAPGTRCFVTDGSGGSAGTGDVDDGPTTVRSPVFDLSATPSAVIRYARHYWCSTGDDDFIVDISNDGGQSWTNFETLTGSMNAWTTVEIKVADKIAPTDQMQLRFVANDNPNNSVTEAAIDDFEVFDYGSAPHLGFLGTPAPSASVELQLAGNANSTWLLFLALGTGNNPVAGAVGTLGLDPATLVAVLSSTIPADGLVRVPVPIPNNPALSGFNAYFQAIEISSTPTFSNVSKLTIQ